MEAVRRMRPVAFKEMWEQFNYDCLPYPFGVRPESPTQGEYVVERIEALSEALEVLSGWYEPALTALTNPAARVEIFGHRRSRPVRVHVGVRDGIACIAAQEPGREADIGGDVTMRAVREPDVGRALANMIDATPSNPPREWRFSSANDNADEQAKRREVDAMMANGFESVLPVGILPGPAIDWRPDARAQSFEIVSLRDHGDFIVNRAARQIVSATPERVAKAFDTYILAVRKAYESRV